MAERELLLDLFFGYSLQVLMVLLASVTVAAPLRRMPVSQQRLEELADLPMPVLVDATSLPAPPPTAPAGVGVLWLHPNPRLSRTQAGRRRYLGTSLIPALGVDDGSARRRASSRQDGPISHSIRVTAAGPIWSPNQWAPTGRC